MRREISRLVGLAMMAIMSSSCISSSDISSIIFYNNSKQYSKARGEYTEEEKCAMLQSGIKPESAKACQKIPGGGYVVLYVETKYDENGKLESKKLKPKHIYDCGGNIPIKPHIEVDPFGKTIGFEFRGKF